MVHGIIIKKKKYLFSVEYEFNLHSFRQQIVNESNHITSLSSGILFCICCSGLWTKKRKASQTFRVAILSLGYCTDRGKAGVICDLPSCRKETKYPAGIIQSDQKVCAHPLITIGKVISNVQCPSLVSGHLLTCRTVFSISVIADSIYVVMVSDWNCLKYFCMFFVL
jgi:hypothetical protein